MVEDYVGVAGILAGASLIVAIATYIAYRCYQAARRKKSLGSGAMGEQTIKLLESGPLENGTLLELNSSGGEQPVVPYHLGRGAWAFVQRRFGQPDDRSIIIELGPRKFGEPDAPLTETHPESRATSSGMIELRLPRYGHEFLKPKHGGIPPKEKAE